MLASLECTAYVDLVCLASYSMGYVKKVIYEWLRENNPNFANFKEFHDCPSPILVEDENSLDEESENSTLEKQIEIQYWFPNNGDPNSSNSVFNSQPEFIDSLLKNKEPTLIFSSRNFMIVQVLFWWKMKIHLMKNLKIRESDQNSVLVSQ